MNLKNRMLPYPVLGISDDILPLPSMGQVNNSRENNTYVFEWEVDVNNEDILSLIKWGMAEYVCEVECQRTFFRKCFKQKQPKFRIEIPIDAISARLEFEVTIVVKEEILGYTNKGFHEDYFGYTFNLEPGDLLCYIGSFYYDVDIDYDKLKAVGTFMKIEQANEGAESTSVFLSDDKICIRLPKPMFDEYRYGIGIDKKVASVIHSSLVFNALLQALYCYDEHLETQWARTLVYRVRTEKELEQFRSQDENGEIYIDKTDVYELAQTLLGDPYHRMFNCLDDLTKTDY